MKRILSKLPALLEADKAAFTAFLSLLLIAGILLSASPSSSQAAPQDWVPWRGSGQPSGQMNSIFCLDEQRCWVGLGGFGGILSTQDGGMTWQSVNSPPIIQYGGTYSVFFLDHSRGFAVTTGLGLYRTRDSGATWEAVKVGDLQLNGVVFVDENTGYGLATWRLPYAMYKTTDAGETWQPWPGQWPGEAYVQFLDENVAWALMGGRRLVYTTDGWQSRAEMQIGSAEDRYSPFDFLDYYQGWYGGCRTVERGEYLAPDCVEALLYRTRDAGRTWERLAVPAPYISVGSINFVNESTGWVVAAAPTKNAILRTDDGGNTWALELEAPFFHLLYNFNERLGWAVTRSSIFGGYTFYKHYPNIALTPTPTPTPTPGPEARENVVPRLYQEVLCRGIDTQGYQYWLNSPLTIEQIRQELINSPEGQRVAAVRSLYLSTLARDPMPTDCGGLRSWVDSDLTLDAIRAGLETSGEGQRVAAVRQLYIELLGRDPLGSDNAGLRYWVQLPLPISDIRRLIMESEEYRQRHGG